MRHGDACTHAEGLRPRTLPLNSCSSAAVSNFKPRCKGWAVYEALVLKAASTYNISNIYLATDDDSIIAAARATQERSGGKLKFLFANIDREGLFASSWFLECVRQLVFTCIRVTIDQIPNASWLR